jgi:hypothetical protein
VSEGMPDEDKVSETVKLVEGFESLIQDSAVLGLEKSFDRLFFNVIVY